MRPKVIKNEPQRNFFQYHTEDIAEKDHPLVNLADKINWSRFDEVFGKTYDAEKGRAGLPTRLMVGLHYLRFAFKLSEEKALEQFIESPYWQYFCGMVFFENKAPCNRSSLTRWRKRVGEKKLETLLAETIEIAKKEKLLKKKDLSEVIFDTTVQEKNVTFPTDSKLQYKAIQKLTVLLKKYNIPVRQTYVKVSKKLLYERNLYARRKNKRKSQKAGKKLKVILGRLLRDIRRKIELLNLNKMEDLKKLLELGERIYLQERKDSNKVYSLHDLSVLCIGKGKQHKKYEFGNKVSVAVSHKSSWVLGIKSFVKNIADQKTLKPAIENVESLTDIKVKIAYADKGYRGKKHHPKAVDVQIPGVGKKTKSMKIRLKRRSSIEPVISHLKKDSFMDRNYLLGKDGNAMNSILSGASQNIRKLLSYFKENPPLAKVIPLRA